MTPPTTVTVVGEFDGVHLGHRRLVEAANTHARRLGGSLGAVVLDATWRDQVILDSAERCAMLVDRGVGVVRALEVAERSTAPDVVDAIATSMSPHIVVLACVPGGDQPSDADQLASWFRRAGMAVVEVERPLDDHGRPITSGSIRRLVAEGDVVGAAALLGRPFRHTGPVVRGNQLGRTIGFPTANVVPRWGRLVPAHGVYAARVHHGGSVSPAAVNVGLRPTVGDRTTPLVEAHLLDFDGDLYGQTIDVDFVGRVRDERRFDGIDELTGQLGRDVGAIRSLLAP